MTVFYSWQSDLPNETNRSMIAQCIKAANLKIEEEGDSLSLLFDEATRGAAGSPEIPVTILNKISNADIFIADITTINQDQNGKKTPNPNVLIELGYAIAELGWERIIMMYNKNYGDFPNDLPFDLDKRRVSTFAISSKDDKNGKGDLIHTLKIGISGIIQTNPNKPHVLKNRTAKTIQREKDIKNITEILKTINISTVEVFLNELPYKIIDRIFFYWESFKSIFDSSSFYIYDIEIKESLSKFKTSWEKTLNYAQHFSTGKDQDYHYYIKHDSFQNTEAEKDFFNLNDDAQEMKIIFKKLIEDLREKFFEIDIDELSELAYINYVDFNNDVKSKLGSID